MLSKLKDPNFWVGVIAVVVALRWAEKTVPAIRTITNPGMNGGA